MAYKSFEVPDLGTVTIYKRRGSRSMRLTVQTDGSVRVTIPSWAPYASGVSFARTRTAWVQSHLPVISSELEHGQMIGKFHRLLFRNDLAASKVTSRLASGTVIVKLPVGLPASAPAAQQVARSACIRALRQQAETLLPQRLAALAETHGFGYRSVSVRQLKSRWGSCDQARNITLNLFLMTLSWELIDYVLLHELTHTEVMQHGPVFWQAMERVLPDVKAARKAIRAHRPVF